MTKEIKTMLEEEIHSCFEDLYEIKLCEEQKKDAIDNVIKLCRLRNEISKIDYENQLALEKIKYDSQVKVNEESEKKKDRIFNGVFRSAELLIPLVAYGAWIILCLDFEERGSIRSTAFRNLINNFRPRRK